MLAIAAARLLLIPSLQEIIESGVPVAQEMAVVGTFDGDRAVRARSFYLQSGGSRVPGFLTLGSRTGALPRDEGFMNPASHRKPLRP